MIILSSLIVAASRPAFHGAVLTVMRICLLPTLIFKGLLLNRIRGAPLISICKEDRGLLILRGRRVGCDDRRSAYHEAVATMRQTAHIEPQPGRCFRDSPGASRRAGTILRRNARLRRVESRPRTHTVKAARFPTPKASGRGAQRTARCLPCPASAGRPSESGPRCAVSATRTRRHCPVQLCFCP